MFMETQKLTEAQQRRHDLEFSCHLCQGPLVEGECLAYHWNDSIHLKNRRELLVRELGDIRRIMTRQEIPNWRKPMSRSKPLTIGEKHFDAQSAAADFIKELLNSQPLKTPIPEPHHSFLHALVFRHPDAKAKIGGGIRHFTVEHAKHGTLCFYITRVDDTRDDFATGKCLKGSA
jgi:hypothetical protein